MLSLGRNMENKSLECRTSRLWLYMENELVNVLLVNNSIISWNKTVMQHSAYEFTKRKRKNVVHLITLKTPNMKSGYKVQPSLTIKWEFKHLRHRENVEPEHCCCAFRQRILLRLKAKLASAFHLFLIQQAKYIMCFVILFNISKLFKKWDFTAQWTKVTPF